MSQLSPGGAKSICKYLFFLEKSETINGKNKQEYLLKSCCRHAKEKLLFYSPYFHLFVFI